MMNITIPFTDEEGENPLNLVGEFEFDIEFDYYPARKGDYYNPPEESLFEITKVTCISAPVDITDEESKTLEEWFQDRDIDYFDELNNLVEEDYPDYS
jgi:hypothetical protein